MKYSKTQRKFHIGRRDLNQPSPFRTNFVKTAKYGLFDFLPKVLFLQFKRYLNIYFLIVSILGCISAISPLNPFTTFTPFIVTVAISVLKEFLQDLPRHKADREVNNRTCTLITNKGLVEVRSGKLNVGDLVLIKDSETFPADLLLISSSNPDGLCLIDISSVDGEKNLKTRIAPIDTRKSYDYVNCKANLSGIIECEIPNSSIYSFTGILKLHEGKKVILDVDQFLYRGAKLKGTAWVVGVIVYTGSDTKMSKKLVTARKKRSNIEQLMNKMILFIFILQFQLSFSAAIRTFVFNYNYMEGHIVYIKGTLATGLEAFISFWNYFLLNNTMIPIMLIPSLELVKLALAYFIEQDEDLFNKDNNKHASVFTSSIIEDLGQVEYIFADKTGTLTCNKMKFRMAAIGDQAYGDTIHSLKNLDASDLMEMSPKRFQHNDRFQKSENKSSKFVFHDEGLESLLKSKTGDKTIDFPMHTSDNSKKTYDITKQSDLVTEYFTLLATCHECLIEVQKNGNIEYHGRSSDDVTLVNAAREIGFEFSGKSGEKIKVNILGEEKEFEVLHCFEFNWTRRRMSVLLRDNKGLIKLYIKGLASEINNRLKAPVQEQPFLRFITEKLELFCDNMFRTLFIGMKVLDQAEYDTFYQNYIRAANSPRRHEEIARLADEMERDIYLIGSVAFEDRLQDNVPEVISDLMRANIKIWMLTGDKLETAEKIASSCNMIQENFHIMRCSENNLANLQNTLTYNYEHHKYFMEQGIKKAFVTDGRSLELSAMISTNSLLMNMFLSITKNCEAVVCAHVSPKQKAQLVHQIRKYTSKITLSIGDGENDINMIQAANIGKFLLPTLFQLYEGVGVYGQEGIAAVHSSNVALTEFQDIWRLLFVHGRWSYMRISEMILDFVYKNLLFTIVQFCFVFLCASSGQAIFHDSYIITYNLIFTLAPLLIRAIFDQDVNYKQISLKSKDIDNDCPDVKKYWPHLYSLGQMNKLFSKRMFMKSVVQGVLHGIGIFLVTHFSLDKNILDNSGTISDLYYFSLTLYTSIILITNLKIAIYTRYWTLFTPIFIGLSVTLYFIFIWIIDSFGNSPITGTASLLFSSCHFYLVVLINCGFVFLCDIGFTFLKDQYFRDIACS